MRCQRMNDRLAFLVQGPASRRPPGAAIPIGGIAFIALDAVKMGMNPCRIGRGVRLNDRMRAVPLAGLKRVERFGEIGDPFDPTIHEAIGAMHVEDLPQGSIAHIEREGFRFADDGALLRTAQVVVAR